jgi:hypothetical protein
MFITKKIKNLQRLLKDSHHKFKPYFPSKIIPVHFTLDPHKSFHDLSHFCSPTSLKKIHFIVEQAKEERKLEIRNVMKR